MAEFYSVEVAIYPVVNHWCEQAESELVRGVPADLSFRDARDIMCRLADAPARIRRLERLLGLLVGLNDRAANPWDDPSWGLEYRAWVRARKALRDE